MPLDSKAIQDEVIGQLATRVNFETLQAGRGVVQSSSKRWRRVSDGNPCVFCAMLVTRGPVYHSKRDAGDKYSGHRYHERCGCTAEPWVGEWSDWEPTPEEQRYVDAYKKAAEQADAANETRVAPVIGRNQFEDHILYRMRQQSGFADSLQLGIDGLTDVEVDALMARLAAEGDWVGAERVAELFDAKQAKLAATVWKPDPLDAFNPQTYEWFERLPETSQDAFLEQVANREAFLQNQWAFANSKTATRTKTIPPERQIRAEWDAYIESEWVRLEEATNGVTLSREARAAGHTTRQLFRVSARTARSWASEEVKRYWDQFGRMTYESFKAGYTGGVEQLASRTAEYWA